MPHDRTTSTNCPWQLLEEHFRHQARVVSHFKNADGRAVIAMWRTGTNEADQSCGACSAALEGQEGSV